MSEQRKTTKCVVIGPTESGKTRLIHKLQRTQAPRYQHTRDFENHLFYLDQDPNKHLTVWDTDGKSISHLGNSFYSDIDILLVVLDGSKGSEEKNIEYLKEFLKNFQDVNWQERARVLFAFNTKDALHPEETAFSVRKEFAAMSALSAQLNGDSSLSGEAIYYSVNSEHEYVENLVDKLKTAIEEQQWEKQQAELEIAGEKREAELKKIQEELPQTIKRMQFFYDLVPYIPFIFNPANGILIAAIAFSIAAIIAAVAPELLAATAPALLCVATGGVIFSVITIIPFTIWEGIKHYHEWRLEMDAEQIVSTEYDNTVQAEIPKHDPYIGSHNHYLSKLLLVKSVKAEPNMQPRAVVSFADSQLGQWMIAHYWQATIVSLGVIFCALSIGACAGFFLGNPICFDLLHPIFALFQSIFSVGIPGLHLPFLAILADPFVIDVITAVFITAVPLIIADNLRRIMQAVVFYNSPSPAKTSDSELAEVKNDATDEDNERGYVLLDMVRDNADTRTWDYLFAKSPKIHELSKEELANLNKDDYEPSL